MMVNAALLIRVSDEEQVKEGFSIDAQKALLVRKCHEWGYNIIDFYIDEGYSAKNMKRPALQRLLKDVEFGEINVIVFWRLDRLTRRSRDFQKIMDVLNRFNVGIRSATEQIDTTTAVGRFQLELYVSLAQLERETISERVHFVMEERHLKGMRNGAVAPYGYDLVDGRLTVNPEQAEVVRRIYDLYLNKNRSVRYIAKLFNRESVDKNGHIWADNTVFYILTNPVYCGKLRWNYRKQAGKRTGKEIVVEGDHEPIVSEELFDAVQTARNRRRLEGKRMTSDFPFSGVLRCARCGYSMHGTSRKVLNGRKRAYKCIGRFNYGICNMPLIAEESVEEAFLNALEVDSSQLRQMIKPPKEKTPMVNTTKLEKELDAIQSRKKKWQLAFANDVISLDDLKQRMEEERQREDEIRKQLEQKPAKRGREQMQEVLKQLAYLKRVWHEIEDDTAKKMFISDLFESITIKTDITEAKGGPGRRVPVEIVEWRIRQN